MTLRWKDLGRYEDRLRVLRRRSPRELLGVAPGASRAALRRAYLRQVRAHHPDLADPFLKKHGEEVVKVLTEAYRSLVVESDHE